MLLDDFLACLDAVKKVGRNQWLARCPAHYDRYPSLSISLGGDERILLDCKAGCETADICAKLGLEVKDLFPEPAAQRRSVATYDYTDPDTGELLYQVVRFEPKDFRQRRPDRMGGWIWKLGDVKRVLYHEGDVRLGVTLRATIYVVEGEKDADALIKAGEFATCNAGGANKWRPEYTEALRGGKVVIVADKDEAGRRHAEQVKAALEPVAASVRVVEALEGKDASDHLKAGYGVEDFVPMGEGEDLDEEPARDPLSILNLIDWPEFWDRDHSVAEWVYPDVLTKGRGHVIYAPHKGYKSLIMLHMAAKIATGPEPNVVLYLDYEMSEADISDRLDEMGYGPESDLSRLRYGLFPALPPLDTKEGGQFLVEAIDALQARYPDHHITCVIDTMSRAVDGPEDKSDTIRAFYKHTGIELKKRGITWLRLDHTGKDRAKDQRGTSAKGDDVDVVWELAKTKNGLQLKRKLSRMSWVPDKVRFTRQEDPLRFTPVKRNWPPGTAEAAAMLDELGVSLDWGRPRVRKVLEKADKHVGNTVLAAALEWRRERDRLGVYDSKKGGDSLSSVPGDSAPGQPMKAEELASGQPSGTGGDSPPEPLGTTAPPTRGQCPGPALTKTKTHSMTTSRSEDSRA